MAGLMDAAHAAAAGANVNGFCATVLLYNKY